MESIKGKDLNILAHSMGGLDARYLLSNIKPQSYNPVSLTTICTPHRGSEFMSWCRANIGIGTDFDKQSEAAAKLAHEDVSIPLPYSLKSPILSRAQVEEARKVAEEKEKHAKEAADKVKSLLKLPGLPKSLSTSVSGYLLDLLDSPAYANLTPNFLSQVFNPSTPDRSDIKYYSIASRTEKIAIWHPLWLPKQVLDGAAAARLSKGIETPKELRGNDGLVNVESAKWGEFLGVIEGCDHWEMRGSSGLISAAATANAVTELMKEGEGKRGGGKENGKEGKGWQWQDLYKLVGSSGKEKKSESSAKGEGSAIDLEGKKGDESNKDGEDAKGLASVASWIVKHLPNSSSYSKTSSGKAKEEGSTVGTLISEAVDAIAPDAVSSSPSASTATSKMMYGAPTSHSNKKAEKFSLEKMTLAICRKLNQDGF